MISPSGSGLHHRNSLFWFKITTFRHAVIAALALGIVFTVGWLCFVRSNSPLTSEVPSPPDWSADVSHDLATLAGPARSSLQVKTSGRPIYRYSVVPGGVRTPQELHEAAVRDQEVAAHYAGFRYDKARIVHLEKPALVYLSYRKNGHIFWTKTKHPLRVGEAVITDGNLTGRTRCANRISVRKQLAVSPEPDPSALDLEQIEAPQLPPPTQVTYPAQYQTALLAPPSSPSSGFAAPTGGGSGLSIFPGGGVPLPHGTEGGGNPGGGSGGGGNPGGGGGGTPGGGGGGGGGGCPPGAKDCPPVPPTPVPEPGTLLLVSSGLAAVGWWKRKLVRR